MEEMDLEESHRNSNESIEISACGQSNNGCRHSNSPGGDEAESSFTQMEIQENKSPGQFTETIDWSAVIKTLLPSRGKSTRSVQNLKNFYDVSYFVTLPRKHKHCLDSHIGRRLKCCLSEVKCQNKCRMGKRCNSFHEFSIGDSFKEDTPDSLKPLHDTQDTNFWSRTDYCDPRLLPIPMAKKREYKSHFDHRVLDYNTMKTKMDHQRQEIKEFTHDVWNGIKSPFAIWSSDLKRIEGHYGTGVLSFFLFLRWMVYLNLLMTVLVILFIVIPENIFHSKEQNIFNSSLTNIDSNFADKNHLRNSECEQQYNNKSIACLNSKSGVPVDILAFCSHNYTASIERKDAIIEMMQEFLQGTGWMELTPMFIGWYKPTALRHIDILPIYDLPIAYMLVTVSYFLLCLILMVFYTRKSIRENILKTESQFQRYCNMVFSGWDFSIEDKKLAEIKHGNILQNFRSHLAEARRFAEVSQWSTSKKVRVTFLRVVINIFVVMILGVSGFGIYKAIIIADKISDTTGFEGLLIEYLPSIIITALNLFLPLLFEFLAKFEHYSLSFTIKVTLIRCVFSQLASICILVGTLHGLIMCDDKTDCGSGYGDCKAPLCWETYVGQQMYKLAMLDFFIALLLTFLVGYPRKVITEKCQSKLAQFIGREEFNIPKNVLNLVYSQTLCWLGAFYSPFLPLLSVMNFIIIFYLKKFALIVNCVPAKESYKASRSNSFFMIVLMLSYLIGVFSFVYSISIIMPSRGCGPFRTYDTAWDVVTISISKFPPQAIATLHFIGSAGFGVPAFIILSLLLYYYLTLSATYSQTAEVLKGHLLVEGRDKHFLLKKLMIILRQPEQ